MKRLALALVMGALGALLLVAPASAQYAPPPPPDAPPPDAPPPDAPPEGCPANEDAPIGQDAPPCLPRQAAVVSDDDVVPGQTITVTTPPVFAPGSQVAINMMRAQRTAAARQLGTDTAEANGVDASITVPDVPRGVYFIYVTGVDAQGNAVVAMTPIVVRSASAGAQAASVRGDSIDAASVAVPTAISDVLPALSPDTEAAVVDAVTQGSAGLVMSPDGTLNVRTAKGLQRASTLPTTGSDGITQQATVGAALLLAGSGLVLLRRRRGGFTQ